MTTEANETWFVRNMKARREKLGISQTDLATRMKERGFPFHQQTVQRIEQSENPRPVRLGEALAISQILEEPLSALLQSEPDYVLDDYTHDVLGAIGRLLELLDDGEQAVNKIQARMGHPSQSPIASTPRGRALSDALTVVSHSVGMLETKLGEIYDEVAQIAAVEKNEASAAYFATDGIPDFFADPSDG